MRSGLQRIDPGRRSLGDYAELAGEETVERIRALASDLEGMRVIHVSPAAPRNNGPEMLRGLLPLATDAGVDVEWRAPCGAAPVRDVAPQPFDGNLGAGGVIDRASSGANLDAAAAAVGRVPGPRAR